MSDSVRPHRRKPNRLPRPWDSPGKNTAVGCHFLLQCMKVKSEREVAQSCPTLSDPMDYSLPGSSIHGIFQTRVLEWGAIAYRSPKQNKNIIRLLEKIEQKKKKKGKLRITYRSLTTVTGFIFSGSKITADGNCSHEIKRHLLLGRKAMTNLDKILKSRH